MNIEKHFHMSGGIGDNSYAENSSSQKRTSDKVKNICMESLKQTFQELKPTTVVIAELGCASGPNTLSFIKDVVECIENESSKTDANPPSIWMNLNDLPNNDFNSIFQALPDLLQDLKKDRAENSSSPLFVAGVPGSFYARLFAENSLHFLYSSFSLHWLSKIPPGIFDERGRSMNKGNICIAETSPRVVEQSYELQFSEDFSLFLRLRSKEMVVGGRMVIIMLGRIGQKHADRGNAFYWEILSKSLHILVSQGLVGKEKLDSYEVHFYAASRDEIESEVIKNGCFTIERCELFGAEQDKNKGCGKSMAMTVRAIQGPMLSRHFGADILDHLFDVYARLVDEEFAVEPILPVAILLALRKL